MVIHNLVMRMLTETRVKRSSPYRLMRTWRWWTHITFNVSHFLHCSRIRTSTNLHSYQLFYITLISQHITLIFSPSPSKIDFMCLKYMIKKAILRENNWRTRVWRSQQRDMSKRGEVEQQRRDYVGLHTSCSFYGLLKATREEITTLETNIRKELNMKPQYIDKDGKIVHIRTCGTIGRL